MSDSPDELTLILVGDERSPVRRIQFLRNKAKEEGNLESNEQMTVRYEDPPPPEETAAGTTVVVEQAKSRRSSVVSPIPKDCL